MLTIPANQAVDNPSVVIETLSPTTDFDRLDAYRSLPSVSELLLHVEHHLRQLDGSWLMRDYSALTDEIELKFIDCRLLLKDVYERAEFEAAS